MTENGNSFNFDNVLKQTIEVFLTQIKQIVQNERKKLLGLALVSLLTCQEM